MAKATPKTKPKLKTVDIKGKPYVEVHERIRHFREHFPDHKLISEFIELNENFCIIKANILNKAGDLIASGFAREVNGDSFINKTSYIENCETSAWGRALGNLGIGVDASVASKEEVANAIEQQKPPKKRPPNLIEQDVITGVWGVIDKALPEGQVVSIDGLTEWLWKTTHKYPKDERAIKVTAEWCMKHPDFISIVSTIIEEPSEKEKP